MRSRSRLIWIAAGLLLTPGAPGGAANQKRPQFQIRLADGLHDANDKFQRSKYGSEFTAIEDRPILTGCHVRLAAVATHEFDTQECLYPDKPCETHRTRRLQVVVFLTDEGIRLKREADRSNVGRELAIMLDGEVLVVLTIPLPSAPRSYPDTDIYIGGRFDESEAAALAARINEARCL